MNDFIDFILSDKLYTVFFLVVAALIIVLIILIIKLVKESKMSNKMNKQQVRINSQSKAAERISRQNDLVNRKTNEEDFKTESIVSYNKNLKEEKIDINKGNSTVNVEEIPTLKPEVKAEIMNNIQPKNKAYETQMLNVERPSNEVEETQLLVKPKPKIIAVLTYKEGEQVKNYEIFNNITNIGRDPEICDIIILNDNFIGRKHALIYFKNDRFYLTDLSSKNGTFINEERIQGERQIYDGDKIKLATTELIFKTK